MGKSSKIKYCSVTCYTCIDGLLDTTIILSLQRFSTLPTGLYFHPRQKLKLQQSNCVWPSNVGYFICIVCVDGLSGTNISVTDLFLILQLMCATVFQRGTWCNSRHFLVKNYYFKMSGLVWIIQNIEECSVKDFFKLTGDRKT